MSSFLAYAEACSQWPMLQQLPLGLVSLIGTFHLSPQENVLAIALVNIHYLYDIIIVIIINYYYKYHYLYYII